MLADPRGSGVCDELLRKQREWIERGTSRDRVDEHHNCSWVECYCNWFLLIRYYFLDIWKYSLYHRDSSVGHFIDLYILPSFE